MTDKYNGFNKNHTTAFGVGYREPNVNKPSEKTTDSKSVYPFNGYAPGNYQNTCALCKTEMHNVDKLCFVCLECAIWLGIKSSKSKDRELAQLREDVERLLVEKMEIIDIDSDYNEWHDEANSSGNFKDYAKLNGWKFLKPTVK